MNKRTLLTLVGIGSALVFGCKESNYEAPKKIEVKEEIKQPEVVKPKKIKFISETPVYGPHGITIAVGDFNNDENLDYIVTGTKIGDNNTVQSYLYLGDGQGKFKLKKTIKE